MGKEIIKIIKLVVESILDIIYPLDNKCIICDTEGFIGICSNCKSSIKRVDNQEEIISYGHYGGTLKKLILNLKYHNSFICGKVLAEMLCELILEKDLKLDYICYVPISKVSLKRRGFNQCEIIANNISEILNIPVLNCLVKIRETKEQKRLSKDERKENVLGAFKVKNKKKIFKKNILLIDDVYTTGSTINECKKNIEKCNINKIYLLTIAKSNI